MDGKLSFVVCFGADSPRGPTAAKGWKVSTLLLHFFSYLISSLTSFLFLMQLKIDQIWRIGTNSWDKELQRNMWSRLQWFWYGSCNEKGKSITLFRFDSRSKANISWYTCFTISLLAYWLFQVYSEPEQQNLNPWK